MSTPDTSTAVQRTLPLWQEWILFYGLILVLGVLVNLVMRIWVDQPDGLFPTYGDLVKTAIVTFGAVLIVRVRDRRRSGAPAA